ncbi:toll/interleukin-1 receptor domain-containing protein [Pararhodobacter sp. CCB-MM2]|uniref:toll/interleukin-1 receptor domain-containing protein n=1 Tax=Pararhodobacter sp. CCB-MM2 TaxID=1786003 RepID=UPI000AC78A5E|nr:toll/interleukin-1 receptor domain-containing protein [Pararhodobacter sp. CCB-MM2]
MRDALIERLSSALSELGLPKESIDFLEEGSRSNRKKNIPTIAIFLGYQGADDDPHNDLLKLIDESSVIIPVVEDLSQVSNYLPSALLHINAIAASLPDNNLERIVTLVLENFKLLRQERRIFISYKRSDSQAVANQIYDALDARGFDVFIDVRSVPPAEDFQDILWHRLTDSDVVVLLDTKGFRESRWTTEELARANLSNIQILHMLWPEQEEDPATAFSHFYFVKPEMLSKADPVELSEMAVAEVCNLCESLRARAIAARHRYLVDTFCDLARDLNFEPNVQPARWISLEAGDKRVVAVPAIGIPTSERIDQIFKSVSEEGFEGGEKWVLYDNRGVLARWVQHLDWLDGYLPARTISVPKMAESLGEL